MLVSLVHICIDIGLHLVVFMNVLHTVQFQVNVAFARHFPVQVEYVLSRLTYTKLKHPEAVKKRRSLANYIESKGLFGT